MSKEELKARAEAKFREEHPFHPTLVSTPPSTLVPSPTPHPPPQPRPSKPSSSSSSSSRLYGDKRAVWEARERARKARERKEEAALERQRVGGRKKGASRSVVGRLFGEAELRRERRERLAKRKHEAELAAFSFKPRTNAASSDVLAATDGVWRPLHERVEEMQRVRAENLHRKRLEQLASDQDLTFAPALNPTSTKLAAARARAVGVESLPDRLEAEAAELEARKEATARAVAREEAQKLTFRPEIADASRKLVAQHPRLAAGFFGRLREDTEARERHREALRAKTDEAAKCTFQPHVHTAPILERRRGDRAAETAEERDARLSGDAELVARKKEAIAQAFYAQFRFQPQIDPVSRAVGRRRTPEEQYAEFEAAQRRRAQREAEREKAFAESHPFQPQLTHAPHSVMHGAEGKRLAVASDPEGLSERIARMRAEKEARLEQMRRDRAYRELRECPFLPETSGEPVPQPTGPIVVRGLGRHLELREMAAKLNAERTAREAEAFAVKGVHPDDLGKPTVPVPFRLASETRAKRDPKKLRRKAKEFSEAKAAIEGECTFRPHTGEAQRSAAVDALLEAHKHAETQLRSPPE